MNKVIAKLGTEIIGSFYVENEDINQAIKEADKKFGKTLWEELEILNDDGSGPKIRNRNK